MRRGLRAPVAADVRHDRLEICWLVGVEFSWKRVVKILVVGVDVEIAPFHSDVERRVAEMGGSDLTHVLLRRIRFVLKTADAGETAYRAAAIHECTYQQEREREQERTAMRAPRYCGSLNDFPASR